MATNNENTGAASGNTRRANTIKQQGEDYIKQIKEEQERAEAELKEQHTNALADYDTETKNLTDEANAAEAAAISQQNDYMNILNGFEDIANTRVQQQAEANRQSELDDYNARTWGGLTEVAANIANLFGAMGGASNQNITSHQQEWANRADTLRRERENKLENYRSQLESLQKQKASIQHSYNTAASNRQLSTNSMLSRRATQRATLARDYGKAEATLASNNARTQATMANNLIKLINDANKPGSSSRTDDYGYFLRGSTSQQ